MARPKNVTITLSPKQRSQLAKLTGETHTEVMFESVEMDRSGKIASRATLGEISAKKKVEPALLPSKKQVALNPLSKKQVGLNPLSKKQVALNPLSKKQVGLNPLSKKQVGLNPLSKKISID